MASLSLAAVTFPQLLSTNIFTSNLNPAMFVLSAMYIHLPSSWKTHNVSLTYMRWQMVTSMRNGKQTERLTWSLPRISTCWIRLSQLVTGADCPTDRKLSTATVKWTNPILARSICFHKDLEYVSLRIAAGPLIVSASSQNWCIKGQRLIQHGLLSCLHMS